jgi:hypothetical protein
MRDKKSYALRDKMKAAQNDSNFNEFSARKPRYGMTITAARTVHTATDALWSCRAGRETKSGNPAQNQSWRADHRKSYRT